MPKEGNWPSINGWREGFQERLLAEGRRAIRMQSPHGFSGFMNALYTLRANIRPRAYVRSEETDQFQQSIEWVIQTLEAERPKAWEEPGAHIPEGTPKEDFWNEWLKKHIRSHE